MFDDNQGRRHGDNDDRDGDDDNDLGGHDSECADKHVVGVSMVFLTHYNVIEKINEWHSRIFFSYYRNSMTTF